MKKLIIAAIAACAMGATFGGDCEVEPGYCAYAYRIKLTGKTVKGLEKPAGSACETGNCWAKPASFRVAGYIYNTGSDQSDATCECECPCDGHWDLTDNSAIFWNADKVQVFEDVTAVEVDVYEVLRNLGYRNKAQVGFKIGDLYLAGFGTYNPESKRLKKAHGFFAGTLPAPKCESLTESCEIESTTAQVFTPCGDEAVDSEKAIAFGRWNMAWKHEKIALLNKGADPLTPGVLVPANFTKIGD